jgi:hypothetical protein
MSELKITNVNEIKEYFEGEIVELAPFENGKPFVARVRVPSLVEIYRLGKIPNTLIVEVKKYFDTLEKDENNNVVINFADKRARNLMNLALKMADVVLIEPSMKELRGAKIRLSDMQLLSIYNYVDKKVSEMIPFRD